MKVVTVSSHAGRSRLMAASNGDVRRFHFGTARVERYSVTDQLAKLIESNNVKGVKVLGTSSKLIEGRKRHIRDVLARLDERAIGETDQRSNLVAELLFLARQD